MKYPAYPKYKPSGVEWLGEVPEHWTTTKFWHCAFFQEGPGLRNWQFTDEGVRVVCVTNITDAGIVFSNYEKFISENEYSQSYRHFTVSKGDLLLSSSGNSWGKVAEFCSDECSILNTSTIRINCNHAEMLNRPFLKWLLQAESTREQLGLFMTGSCQPNFGPSHLSRVLVAVPHKEEQRAIADFLDRETAKLDTLVSKKRELIEKLKEKRTALISRTVTRGLPPEAARAAGFDPNPKLKPSGIEWLGEVPEHWEVKRLGHLVSKVGSGKTPKGGAETYQEEGVMLIRSQNVYDDGLHLEDVVFIDEGVDEEMAVSRVFPGDVLLNITGASLGRCTIAPSDFSRANVNQHVCILRPETSKVDGRFLQRNISSMVVQSQIFSFENGSSREGLNFQQIRSLLITLPPLAEQRAIAGYLDREAAKIDQRAARVEEALTRLQEYRAALITAAVTGKIDVRE
ncbi:MAG: restriction endonuclease subunit S [bacterium]